MNQVRKSHGLAVAHGCLYAFGGETGASNSPFDYIGLDSVEYLDLTFGNVNAWTTTTKMSSHRHGLGSATIYDKVYAIGGMASLGGQNTVLDTVERFDPFVTINGVPVWTSTAKMPTPLWAHAAVGVEGATEDTSKIYVLGGKTTNTGLAVNTGKVYDVGTDNWVNLPDMKQGTRYYGAAAVVDNVLYAIGGFVDGNMSGKVESLDLTNPSAQWIERASMIHLREGHTVAVIKGLILAIGGTNGPGPTELYDPSTNTWESFVPCNERTQFSADIVVSNKLYRTGGADNHPRNATKNVTVHDLGFMLTVARNFFGCYD
uniref:Uncharacterized protein n=1 Tax=viral metagenome TaxID=1070528 RepID=A0A6C0KCP2_9ZZZZ